jgi:hypothetical protein
VHPGFARAGARQRSRSEQSAPTKVPR